VPVMMSSAAVLVKTFRATRTPFRARAKTVRLPAGIAVRLQPGIPFVFTPESFSRSPRNPFRLPPESARLIYREEDRDSWSATRRFDICQVHVPEISDRALVHVAENVAPGLGDRYDISLLTCRCG
jgi:hypothetical protein